MTTALELQAEALKLLHERGWRPIDDDSPFWLWLPELETSDFPWWEALHEECVREERWP